MSLLSTSPTCRYVILTEPGIEVLQTSRASRIRPRSADSLNVLAAPLRPDPPNPPPIVTRADRGARATPRRMQRMLDRISSEFAVLILGHPSQIVENASLEIDG